MLGRPWKVVTETNHDHHKINQNWNLRRTRPLLTHAAAAASVPVYESCDAVRSQKGRFESAPSNPETEEANQSSRGRSRAGNFLGVAASEKRDPKRTNKWQSHDDCCPSKHAQ